MHPLLLVTVIQYITVSGGTCNMLSVCWQFTGEICFIKAPENDCVRMSPGAFVLCLGSDQRVSVKPGSRAFVVECRHSRE